MPTDVEEIKTRLDIVDLVSEYVKLKQLGTNWKGLCPFHTEKTPSFMVSRDKQIWHCFGCSEGGDVFSFIQKIEGLEFPDALRLLAQKAGVELTHQDPAQRNQRHRLLDICASTVTFWHSQLRDPRVGKTALDYLHNRGLTDKTIDDFQIGFAVESWDVLLNHLKSKVFTEQEIFLAGLLVKKDRGSGFYDRFRDRIMFPINDVHGNPIGFTGRQLHDNLDAGGKYINTPQTELYNKSQVIFNLDKAKTEIRKQNLAVLVEGQMDVISSVQAGVRNVVAVSGTALTVEQVQLLKRFTTNLAISLDADAAGRKAAERSANLIQDMSVGGATTALDRFGKVRQYFDPATGQEMDVSIITLPFGKDPDECIQHNPKDWVSAVSQPRPVLDYLFEQTSKDFDLGTALGKKGAASRLLGMITKIANPIEQTHWLQRLGQLLQVSEQVLRDRLPKATTLKYQSATPSAQPAPSAPIDRQHTLGRHVLALSLRFPDQLPGLLETLPAGAFSEPPAQALYNQLILFYTETDSDAAKRFDYQEFSTRVSDSAVRLFADMLLLQAEKDFFHLDDQTAAVELKAALDQLSRGYFRRQLTELGSKIDQAERAGANETLEQLATEFNELAKRLAKLG